MFNIFEAQPSVATKRTLWPVIEKVKNKQIMSKKAKKYKTSIVSNAGCSLKILGIFLTLGNSNAKMETVLCNMCLE